MAKIIGKKIDLQTWTEVEDSDCNVQNKSGREIFVQFSSDEPTNLKDCFVLNKYEFINYISDNDKLWVYNPYNNNCYIAIHKQTTNN